MIEEGTTKSDLIKIYTDQLLPVSITGADGKNESEIIDIISNYSWTSNPLKSGTFGDNSVSFQHNIPFCYIVELRQTVNSSIMNMLNTLKGTADILPETLQKGTSTIGSVVNAGKSIFSALTSISSDNGSNTGNSGGTIGGDVAAQSISLEDMPQVFSNANSGDAAESPSAPSDTTKAGQSQETVNATANNGTGTVAAQNVSEVTSQTTSSSSSIAAGFASNINNIQKIYQGIINKWDKVQESNFNTDMLSPYSFLYFTKKTGKKYVFPMLSDSELLNASNSWGDVQMQAGLFGFDFAEGAKNILEFMFGANMLFDLFNDNSGATGATPVSETYSIELAKAFNYNQDGPSIKSNFILYNTVKKDAWKQNYRFLTLFLLRNLAFKVSAYSFIPPLLYDIIIPGVKHLPLCYVSSINVINLGHVRHLKINHFIKEILGKGGNNTSMVVSVPEAWQVSVSFKSILPNTANLILDLANSPINISTTTISASK